MSFQKAIYCGVSISGRTYKKSKYISVIRLKQQKLPGALISGQLLLC
jgi:hypothetical protein